MSLTSGAATVSGGGTHTCATTNEGGVKCWGDNYVGELGNGTTTRTFCSCIPTAVDVTGLTAAAAVSAGIDHTCALTTGAGSSAGATTAPASSGTGRMDLAPLAPPRWMLWV